MAGTTKQRKSANDKEPEKMEVSAGTYTTIKALYPIGVRILQAFEAFSDEFEELGDVKSAAVGIQLRDELVAKLSDNFVSFSFLNVFNFIHAFLVRLCRTCRGGLVPRPICRTTYDGGTRL